MAHGFYPDTYAPSMPSADPDQTPSTKGDENMAEMQEILEKFKAVDPFFQAKEPPLNMATALLRAPQLPTMPKSRSLALAGSATSQTITGCLLFGDLYASL